MIKRLLAVLPLAALLLSGCGDKAKTDNDPKTLLKAAVAAQAKGDDDAAVGMFNELLKKEPGNVIAHYNLGVIYQKRNQIDAALREYGAALTTNASYVPALFNTATIYGNTDPPLAITTYRKVISLQPNAPTAYLNLGLLELGSGLEAQGIRDLTTALHQDPTLSSRLTPQVKAKVGKGTSPSPSASP
jgi:tetratricopeptide (TPR) repeat protein